MKSKPVQAIPVMVAAGVVTLVFLAAVLRLDFFERLERITYDMRAREAAKFPSETATNLGFVAVDDQTIQQVHDGTFGYHYGLYWPRQVYGRMVKELRAQGARVIAFDVMFGEMRPDHPPVQMEDGSFVDSDEFLAREMRQASNVVLAAVGDLIPAPMFERSARALGDISTDKDKLDGVLRRAKAFRMYRRWHPVFQKLEADPGYGVDLSTAVVERDRIVLPRKVDSETDLPADQRRIIVPLDREGKFDLTDFVGDDLPAGTARRAKPFVDERVWHMGLVIAAIALNLDLTNAEIATEHGRIVLHGPGVSRVIPVDREGYFYIDWSVSPNDRRLTQGSAGGLLREERLRAAGKTNDIRELWRGKLAVIGSSAQGNDLTDRGATPLQPEALLVSKHWNVANSVIMGRFVHRAPLGLELGLIVFLGVMGAIITWQLRALVASGLVLATAAIYIGLGVVLYVRFRYWIPLVLPICGALIANHVCLLAWRVVFEETERRRVKSIFSKMVSPKIVNELLAAERLSLGGARREITVLFADVRGFTELTDKNQEMAAEFVRQNRLTGAEAEAVYDKQASETLETINQYLGVVADVIKKEDGTLDKFIGDCVMAFWGAPTSHGRHAAACVHAAIDAQRAIAELNQQRIKLNLQREIENRTRIANGLPELPMLPTLVLGTGINTGLATAGLMGSLGSGQAEQLNYTVFGREVNLASRLEGASGRGRIFISERTYEHLLRDDPELAPNCIESPERLKLKGFSTPVKVYEVPWQAPAHPPAGRA